MPQHPALGDRLVALFDQVWPHLAAWGLAALIAFFAVRERLTMMERDGAALVVRIEKLEQAQRETEHEVGGIRVDTTRIRTLVEVIAKESDERRADERARYRAQEPR